VEKIFYWGLKVINPSLLHIKFYLSNKNVKWLIQMSKCMKLPKKIKLDTKKYLDLQIMRSKVKIIVEMMTYVAVIFLFIATNFLRICSI